MDDFSTTQRISSLETIAAIADVLHRSLDFKTVAERAVEAITAYTSFSSASVFSIDETGTYLDLVSAKGFSDAALRAGARMPIKGSFMGIGLAERRVVSSNDLDSETRGIKKVREILRKEGYGKAISVPLIYQDKPLGTLNLLLKGDRKLNNRERETLLSIAKTIALAMANAKQVARIKQEVREREKAQDQLRRSEMRYSLATAAAKVGVWDWNIATGDFYLDPNVKALLGYTDDEIPNDLEKWSEFIYEEDKPAVEEVIGEHLAGRTPQFVCEHRMVHKDGSLRWILARGHAMRDENGEAVRMVGTDADITERKLLQERIGHAEKLDSLAVLAGGIAHDFNNMLTSILANAALLREEIPQDSISRVRVEVIEQAANRASELTAQLLAIAGKGTLAARPIALCGLVRELDERFRHSIPEKTTLKYELVEGSPTVEADPARIGQVITNLVVNASEALPAGKGVITVRTGFGEIEAASGLPGAVHGQLAPGRHAWVEVADNGRGMDETAQAKMFDPFYSTKFPGRGLGLAAASAIVRAHGGVIAVKSAPGTGTTVRVVLPLTEPLETPVAPAPAETTEQVGLGTILVVDDERWVRLVAADVLGLAGYEVITAEDGREGLDFFMQNQGRISLVLLDVTMPRLSGLEVLDAIRRIRPDARVVLTSGYSAKDIDVDDTRIDAFLPKPWNPAQLLDTIREVLDRP